MNLSDYYRVLGLRKNAADEEVRDAYLRLAKRYHPDMYLTNTEKVWATQRFILIDGAYKQIVKERIAERETSSFLKDLGEAIITRLDKKLDVQDTAIEKLNVYFIGAIIELIFFGVTFYLMAVAFNPMIAIIGLPVVVVGIVLMWRAFNR